MPTTITVGRSGGSNMNINKTADRQTNNLSELIGFNYELCGDAQQTKKEQTEQLRRTK